MKGNDEPQMNPFTITPKLAVPRLIGNVCITALQTPQPQKPKPAVGVLSRDLSRDDSNMLLASAPPKHRTANEWNESPSHQTKSTLSAVIFENKSNEFDTGNITSTLFAMHSLSGSILR